MLKELSYLALANEKSIQKHKIFELSTINSNFTLFFLDALILHKQKFTEQKIKQFSKVFF